MYKKHDCNYSGYDSNDKQQKIEQRCYHCQYYNLTETCVIPFVMLDNFM